MALFVSRTGSSVIKGKDDWLFYVAEDMVQQYRGVHPFSERDLQGWQELLERRRDWLAKQGIRYLFVIAPDKQSIYAEELPGWLVKARPQTRLDQFVAYMKAKSTVPILDLRPALRQARKLRPTYLKTDTHWNLYGGLVASQEIAGQLRAADADGAGLSLDAFEVEQEDARGGDLTWMLGLDPGQIVEGNALRITPRSPLKPLETRGNSTWNGNADVSENAGMGKLLVFHDSFGTALEPFLGYRFAVATYAWRESLDPALIEKSGAQAVVTEMVERSFNTHDPRKLMALEEKEGIADQTATSFHTAKAGE
jgi:hypothetical protein